MNYDQQEAKAMNIWATKEHLKYGRNPVKEWKYEKIDYKHHLKRLRMDKIAISKNTKPSPTMKKPKKKEYGHVDKTNLVEYGRVEK